MMATVALALTHSWVQRAFPRQRRATTSALRLELPEQRSEQRLMAQTLMSLRSFVPQGHPEHRLSARLDQAWSAIIGKSLCQAIGRSGSLHRPCPGSMHSQPEEIRASAHG